MQATALIGSWRLVSWRALSEHGDGASAITYPMGRNAVGPLHYGADGRMAVLIAAGERRRFATDDLLGGSVEERAAAFASFIAYPGSFTLGDGIVTHTLEISSFPNWLGTEQVRFTALDGDRLVLSTAPIPTSGARRRSELAWTRIPSLAS